MRWPNSARPSMAVEARQPQRNGLEVCLVELDARIPEPAVEG